jgi:sporulation protein YlmC with PRC-barrel domain
LICATLSFVQTAHAEERTKSDLGQLLGTTVLSADASEIGVVEDVQVDERGAPTSIRVKSGRRLGFGTQTVQLPKGTFAIVRGQVVVDLPKEAIEMLPSLDPEGVRSRDERADDSSPPK